MGFKESTESCPSSALEGLLFPLHLQCSMAIMSGMHVGRDDGVGIRLLFYCSDLTQMREQRYGMA